ncbi:MAG TPA: MupA/Atu3671 family FMN-dependent luciferase-like monooxygenase [Actinophytocola sp.]|uniref:non-ribosomal peptide synthetase/type I polyketide synthase n=1 Tax=Actinophytocola sp. TaxID=1872138 RepID=UPI002DDD39B3|nr:MupA/Atu3671 family FMN-dependent luciferase-like monooxygenase [Actinophytocola sp.]HEV2784623.1 MupA/Atu3671 family FMN-dependent luciferase-like monooxygenase [Actinophytocola sp.]
MSLSGNEIAIVGMAARFPGAPDLPTFWRNLRAGTESISVFGEAELETSPLVPERARRHPGFVPAGGVLDGGAAFDHDFFGIPPREARWMDPQQRVFLEVAWAALEDAGYDPWRYPGRIAVYAGAGASGHQLALLGRLDSDPASLYEALGGSAAQNLATKASFLLRLRGESMNVHTACSTGLATVHLACQSLLLGQSSLAIAGAVSLSVPQRTGYVHQEGMILSPDGHCRAFDHRAAGTVPGNGVGVVVLKPLADAVADRDHVYAVIKGSAINNEGHRSIGYTAPSVAAQAEVIAEALAFAEVSAADIGYVEAHGTGTPLGDPIEIAALTRAYRRSTDRVGDCPLGSVKTNIGHLDTAAGIAGLIKVALMLRHGEIPPSLHLERPNPAIDFAASPFVVNTELRPWTGSPRLAGVSSFGIGGTNVHAVLAEPPAPAEPAPSARPYQVVPLAAHTRTALSTMADELAGRSDLELADVAYTRAVGRAELRYRRAYVAAGAAELADALRDRRGDPAPVAEPPRVGLLFPGQGAAFYGMAGELYRAEPVFRAELDSCVAELELRLGTPLLPALLDGAGPILDPELAHPALFAVEHALARLWLAWGVRPAALLGHSFGEYAAACLAGVLTLPDAAELAVARGRLVAKLPDGAMIAVGLAEAELASLVDPPLSLAAVNGDGRCVVSGPVDAVAELGARLAAAGHAVRELPVRRAFHSPAVEPILPELVAVAERLPGAAAPALPLLSSRSGTWWADDDGGPEYWARQMREPVRFAAALETLAAAEDEPLVLIEVGADQGLTTLAMAQLRDRALVVPSLRRRDTDGSDHRVLLEGVGAVWSAGLPVDWDAFYRNESRGRVPLPSYPFERVDCRLDAPADIPAEVPAEVPALLPAGGPAAAQDAASEGPRDDIERKVFEIWRERLGTDEFGIHDNFLELGGNSLSAVQLINRLRAAFPVPIPLAMLFEEPTVAGVAGRIRDLLGDSGAPVGDELPPIRPVPRDPTPPLSVVQARTLALEAADPGNPALAMPVAVELAGALDVAALEAAIRVVAGRHETLRTTFHCDGGLWTQRIEPEARVALEIETVPGAEPAARLAREEAARPFDLAAAPLRARLLRLAEDNHILLLTVHHVVSDTLSMVNLVREIGASYEAIVAGAPSPLPPLAVQYADFAAWQRRIAGGDALDRQRAYWRATLADLPRLALPTDRPRSAERGLRGRHLEVGLSPALSTQVYEVSQRLGVTPFITLLAAYTAFLGRISGARDVVVGTPIGNRERAELEPLIGYVAHALPLRTDLDGDPSFAELVSRTRRTVLSAYAHPDLPYEELAPGTARLFDALFVLHAGIPDAQELAGMTWRQWQVPDMPAMFAATLATFSLMLAESPTGLSGTLTYAEELFGEATARSLFDKFTALLEDGLRRPDTPLSKLRLDAIPVPVRVGPPAAGPLISLSFFANDENAIVGPKYALLLEAARLADEHGLAAIWTPERHFHAFGGLYPSPTATGAALAAATRRIGIRAGSVVLPLHDPIRVAEDWSVIDNISGGRVGVSFASGWHPNDFVLAPDRYADRREVMRAGIEEVRRLWRGETVVRRNGIGDEVAVAIRPRPVQPELPFWLTAAGSPDTFRIAGELGAFLLTNLMAQTMADLAGKIKLYREAWRAAGHAGDGHVTLMLHAFLADSAEEAYAVARPPLLRYFRSSVDISRGFAVSQGLAVRPEDLTEDDLRILLEHGVERYLRDGALIGTPASCAPVLDRVSELDVDEVAALIDFGVPAEAALRGVRLLGTLAAEGRQRHVASRTAPLSYAQQRLWYLDQLEPGNVAYNNAVALRMRGELDTAALHRALDEVVRRHEVLRTTIEITPDGPVQVIHPALDVELPVRPADAADVDRLATDFARTPFDLERGPLLRTCLLRLGPDEHVLLICLHHIVSDGWSAGVLCAELAAMYAGGELPPLPMQYADYAVWQRERPDSPGDLAYWTENLAGVPMLELPVDRPRGPVQGRDGARVPVRIPRELADALGGLCRATGSTPYMALHAGLVTLLHRYSGQTDLAIGTAVAGRTRPETENLVGCFINSVVIRTDLAGDPTFRELLGRVKRATLGAVAHQEIPFERLVNELEVPRTLSHAPLFQAMLVLHNTPSPTVRLGALTLEPLDIDPRATKLDLILELREGEDGISGCWEYNTDLFDPATIEQLTRHLLGLLADAVADPDRRLSGLTLLSDDERREVLALSTGAPLDTPDGVVHAAFEAQVARTPDAIAIGDERRPLTYRELDIAANRIAHGLRDRGVRPGRVVALLLEQPTAAIPAMLGVLKAGGAYVPVDPHAPRARRDTILAAADPVVIIGADREPAGHTLADLAAGQPDDPPPALATASDPAYIIFTSGSTGTPKGVVVEHRHLLFSTLSRRAHYGEPGRCLSLQALTFDGSLALIYFALLFGGTIWRPEREVTAEPHRVAELIARHRLTRVAAAPAYYGQLLAAVAPGQLDSLRSATVGGDTCPPELVLAHRAAVPRVELHNEYGPTEVTIWSTVHRVDHPPNGPVPIGRSIPGVRNYVLDPHGRPLPVGATGELYVGGPAVARGYLGAPDLTRERFLPDPFSTVPNGRMYRTGDRARWNRAGVLEFLGRIDRQVKIRGFRVEPAETEAVLAAHPAVAEAAVIPVRSATTRLVGYVAPSDVDVEELRAFAEARLPDYLVPAQLVAIPELPRTRHGKVDVRALPEPEPPAAAAPVAPRTDAERALAAVIAEVLRIPEVGVHDDFFALGGDSILAMSVVTRARARSIELTVRQLFQNPTVARLATVAGTRLVAPAEQGPVTGPVLLTPIQRWLLDQDLPEPDHWNMSVHMELHEPLRPDPLQEAFRTVLRHHDALRLRFTRRDGTWRQHNAPVETDWTLWTVDLSDTAPGQQAAELTAHAERLHRSLDLASGPLLRAALIHRGQGLADQLLVVAHHLVTDGVSWRIILTDLFAAYRSLAAGQPVVLPPKTTSYAQWSRGLADLEPGRAEIDYWTGLPFHLAPRLPRDGDGPNTCGAARMLRVELDEADTRRLTHDLPRGAGVHEALLTAIASAVAGWTGADHVQLDIERHGREDLVPGLDVVRTVGWFSDFHPTVLPVPHGDPAGRLAVVAETLGSVPHRGAGYVPLRHGTHDSPLRGLPPSELTVNYLGQLDAALPPDAPATILGDPPGSLRSAGTPRPHLIEVTAGVLDHRLWLVWTYAEGIHRPETVERLATHTTEQLRRLGNR